jgi:transcriptional regulator with XRE-family HTH domain
MVGPSFPSSKQLGEVVRDLRELQGIGVDVLAQRCSLEPSIIGDLEAGYGELRLSVMLAVADGLGISMSALCRAAERRVAQPHSTTC